MAIALRKSRENGRVVKLPNNNCQESDDELLRIGTELLKSTVLCWRLSEILPKEYIWWDVVIELYDECGNILI